MHPDNGPASRPIRSRRSRCFAKHVARAVGSRRAGAQDSEKLPTAREGPPIRSRLLRGRSEIGDHAAGKQRKHPGSQRDRREGHDAFGQILAACRRAEAPMQHDEVREPDRDESHFRVEGGVDPELRRLSPVGTWIASPVAASGMAMRPTAAAPRPRSRTALMSNTPMPPTTKAAPNTCSRFETVKKYGVRTQRIRQRTARPIRVPNWRAPLMPSPGRR